MKGWLLLRLHDSLSRRTELLSCDTESKKNGGKCSPPLVSFDVIYRTCSPKYFVGVRCGMKVKQPKSTGKEIFSPQVMVSNLIPHSGEAFEWR